MIGFLGRTVLLLSLVICVVALLPAMIGGSRAQASVRGAALRLARGLTLAFAACATAAMILIEIGLLTHDFSLSYVAEIGSLSTPLVITIVSVWSSLGGSILFWIFILGLMAAAFVFTSRDHHEGLVSVTLGSILLVGAFFAFVVTSAANPFTAVFPVPVDGPGPNALLQNHPLMVLHPPALYLGYVGMVVPAAMAVASLVTGRLDAAWIALLRRWSLFVWAFLTLGIVLGGLWSYEVLGWGGYWAWDPVENASLIPWLTLTAFLHSAMMTERRGTFQGWTLSLVLASFLLTLLGTFMTRSGIFNSVHAFTQSSIGPMFLAFIAFCFVGSVLLLSSRLERLQDPEKAPAPGLKDASFLLNNLLFVAFAFTVLLGTLYPLIIEAVTGEKLSVGEPYFNKMAVPLFGLILFWMGVGPALPWGRGEARLRRHLVPPLVVALLSLGGAFAGLGVRSPLALLAVFGAAFAGAVSLREILLPVLLRSASHKESFLKAAWFVSRAQRRRVAAHLVHLGVVIAALAIVASSGSKTEKSLSMSLGQSAELGAWRFTLKDFALTQEPNRTAEKAIFEVERAGKPQGLMEPRLNHYSQGRQAMGTPSVRRLLREDFYLSVLTVDRKAGTVALRAIVEPMVSWLWAGSLLMVLGSLLTLLPRSRRPQVLAKTADEAPSPGGEV